MSAFDPKRTLDRLFERCEFPGKGECLLSTRFCHHRPVTDIALSRDTSARRPKEVAMKLGVGIAVFFWLLCGLIGAWMLDDLDADHWKKIARGPITLAAALSEHPVTFQGSN